MKNDGVYTDSLNTKIKKKVRAGREICESLPNISEPISKPIEHKHTEKTHFHTTNMNISAQKVYIFIYFIE